MLDTGAAEEMNLLATEQRLFAAAGTADVVRAALTDAVIAERIEAFVARFSRFQDLLGDKLLPLVLRLSGDGVQPMIGNLDRLYRVVNEDTGLQADFMPVIHGVRSFEGLRSRSVARDLDGLLLRRRQ